MKFSTFAAVLAVAGLCVSAQAAGVSAGAEVKSAYVASGTTVNDGFVFAPWVDVYDLKVGEVTLPLTFEVWANMDLEDDFDSAYKAGSFSEIDFSIDLDLTSLWADEDGSKFSASIGYLEYDYPTIGGESENLITAKLAYDCILNPSFKVKYRFEGPNKEKCEFIPAISHSFALTDDIAFSLAADCVYVSQAKDSDLKDGFACADVTATLSFMKAYVSATYVANLDEEVLPNADAENIYAYDVEWIGAVGIAYDFQ